MQIFLRFDSGKNAGREIRVRGNVFLIGRGEDCHLRPTSELVSRRHCALLMQGDTVLIRDFKSSNGTFVNGQRVEAECQLVCGDQLSVGPLQFTVRYEAATEPAAKATFPAPTPEPGRVASQTASDDVIQSWLVDETPEGRVELVATAVGDRLDLVETVSDDTASTHITRPSASRPIAIAKPSEKSSTTSPQFNSTTKAAVLPHAEGSSGAAKVAISEFIAKMTKARKERP